MILVVVFSGGGVFIYVQYLFTEIPADLLRSEGSVCDRPDTFYSIPSPLQWQPTTEPANLIPSTIEVNEHTPCGSEGGQQDGPFPQTKDYSQCQVNAVTLESSRERCVSSKQTNHCLRGSRGILLRLKLCFYCSSSNLECYYFSKNSNF